MPNQPHPRTHHKRRHTLIALAPLLPALATFAIILAGCGGSSEEGITTKPAAAILAASANAARNASSVRVVSKSSVGKTPVGFELQLAGQQGGLARTSLGALSGEAIRVGNTVYVKVGPVLAERLSKATGTNIPAGSWLQAPTTNPQIASSALLTKTDGELLFLLRSPTVSITKGPITTVKGQKTIELKTKGKLYTGQIYIAVTGTPYPIEIIKHPLKKSHETHTTFTNWNQPIKLPTPPNATQLANLEHKAS
jgi:hypothetical protein